MAQYLVTLCSPPPGGEPHNPWRPGKPLQPVQQLGVEAKDDRTAAYRACLELSPTDIDGLDPGDVLLIRACEHAHWFRAVRACDPTGIQLRTAEVLNAIIEGYLHHRGR